MKELPLKAARPCEASLLRWSISERNITARRNLDAAVRVPKSRSPYNYYGLDHQSEVGTFGKEFAAFLGFPYKVAVSSSTGALHVALSALGVGPGQEVILKHPQGLSSIGMTDWDLHLCINTGSLLERASIDPNGFPRNPAESAESHPNYGRGAGPLANSLFERSVVIAIPSSLTARDEDDIIFPFERTLGAPLQISKQGDSG